MAVDLRRLTGPTGMAMPELRAEWQRLYRGRILPDGMSPDLLRRCIAWRAQEKRHGGLSPARVRELDQLAERLRCDGAIDVERHHQLKPGTRLVHKWHGKVFVIEVLDQGYLFEDRHYASLTRIAREITGAAWSGPRFFGLVKRVRVQR